MKFLYFALSTLILSICAYGDEHLRIARAVTSPHAKIVKEYEPKINVLKNTINVESATARRQIDSAKSSFSAKISSAVKGADNAINQKRNAINTELTYLPNTEDNLKLRECLKTNLDKVIDMSSSDISFCSPKEDIFTELYKTRDSIQSQSNILNQLSFMCTIFYPLKTQATQVEQCFEDGLNDAQKAYTSGSKNISKIIEDAYSEVEKCIADSKNEIYDELDNLNCWKVDPPTTEANSSPNSKDPISDATSASKESQETTAVSSETNPTSKSDSPNDATSQSSLSTEPPVPTTTLWTTNSDGTSTPCSCTCPKQ